MALSKAIELDLTDSELSRLGMEVSNAIYAGLSETSGLVPRWNQQEKHYRNVPEITREHGLSQLHIPLVRPLLERLNDQTEYVLTSQNPLCKVRMYGLASHQAYKIERAITHFLMMDDQFSSALQKVLPLVCYQHIGFTVPRFDYKGEGDYPKIVLDVVDSRDVSVYPLVSDDLESKKAIFRRVVVRKAQFLEDVENGIYEMDVPPHNVLSGEQSISSRVDSDLRQWYCISEVSSGNADDDFVVLWDGFYKYRGKGKSREEWYKVTILDFSQKIIRFKKSLNKYCNFAYGCYERDNISLFPVDGLCTKLQGLQFELNSITNTGLDGFAFDATPSFLYDGTSSSGLLAAQNAVMQLRPGAVLPIKGIVPIASKGNSGLAINWGEWVWRRAQLVVGVSDVNLGQKLKGAQTLGEVQLAHSESYLQIDKKIKSFSQTWANRVFKIVCELLYDNFEIWQETYGEILEIEREDKELFNQKTKPIVITGAVDSYSASPAGRKQILMEIINVLYSNPNIPLNVFAKMGGYEILSQYIATLDIPNRNELIVGREEAVEVLRRLANAEMESNQDAPLREGDAGIAAGDSDAMGEPSGEPDMASLYEVLGRARDEVV